MVSRSEPRSARLTLIEACHTQLGHGVPQDVCCVIHGTILARETLRSPVASLTRRTRASVLHSTIALVYYAPRLQLQFREPLLRRLQLLLRLLPFVRTIEPFCVRSRILCRSQRVEPDPLLAVDERRRRLESRDTSRRPIGTRSFV